MMKDMIIKNIPFVQAFMKDDPNYIRKCIMMYRDPNMRALLEQLPWFKNITQTNPEIFKKIEDPNIVLEIPSNEEINNIFNKLKDENETRKINNGNNEIFINPDEE